MISANDPNSESIKSASKAALDEGSSYKPNGTYRYEPVFRMNSRLDKSYDVIAVNGLLDQNNHYLSNLIGSRRALVVTTPTVHRLYGQAVDSLVRQHHLDVRTVVLECTEQNKTIEMVERLCHTALEFQLGRKDLFIALSGGVCSDIVTVAASLLRRGIAYVRIPTTLIGQIDAGIGVKGAVNFYGKKSFLGYFYAPEAVLNDQSFLKTLPQRHHRYGLAEIIKMAVVHDAELFHALEEHCESLISSAFQKPNEVARRVLRLATKGMLEQLETNLFEDQTYKRLVDMGHTFSPALEAAANFSIHHGEAVAIDVALSATISQQLGLLSERERDRILSVISAAGLATYSELLTYDLCIQALDEVARHRGGSINLVLPTKIGEATFLERSECLTRSLLEASLTHLRQSDGTATRPGG